MTRICHEGAGIQRTFEPNPSPAVGGDKSDTVSAQIEVRRYVKPDGWVTRYWAIYTGGELLAVVVYKKGAQAIADRLLGIRF